MGVPLTDDPIDASPDIGTELPSAPRSRMDRLRSLWHDDLDEVLAVVLLGAATLLSAWGAYQATRWSGEQANSYAESAKLRAESGRMGTVASRQIQIDVETFLDWMEHQQDGDLLVANDIRERLRAEFVPAFEAWLATGEADGSLPAGTPFDLPDYVLAAQGQSDALDAQADAALAEAQSDNQIADDFVLTSVLFASVLFFAGIGSRFKPRWIRRSMAAIAVALFAFGMVIEFSLPQSVSF